jgi:Holliday junction resolvase RusA-like endonuclease
MSSEVTFRVPGDPIPQPRPRVSTRGGFAKAYVPAKHPVHEFRSRVADAARAAGLNPRDGPVSIEIVATFGRPRSHLNKSGVKRSAPALPRPDVDNVAKAVLDALQDALGDDTRVARLMIEKGWGSEGCTTVTVTTRINDAGDNT